MNAHWTVILVTAFMFGGLGHLLPSDEEAEPASPVEALAIKSGCLECHSVDSSQGPTFHDIGDRYQDDEETRGALYKTIMYGSKGNWTEVSRGVPMPPYSNRLSENEIYSLIDWILNR